MKNKNQISKTIYANSLEICPRFCVSPNRKSLEIFIFLADASKFFVNCSAGSFVGIGGFLNSGISAQVVLLPLNHEASNEPISIFMHALGICTPSTAIRNVLVL